MKKTLTINLNNTVFHIDEDAYELLQKYLDDLKSHFAGEADCDEILRDVEARICELFNERIRFGLQVITFPNVEEIINMMGQPSDYGTVDEVQEEFTPSEPQAEEASSGNASHAEKTYKGRKRLYRDKGNGMIGGVAAGLAAYLNIDVTWIRILLLISIIITSGSIFLIYLILWIITPSADSAAQKLEMRGIDPTIENISSFVKENAEKVADEARDAVHSPKNKSFLVSLRDLFLQVVRGVVKFVVAVLGVGFGCLGLLIILPLLMVLSALVFSSGDFFSMFFPYIGTAFADPTQMPFFVTATVIVISIPLLVLCYVILQRAFNYPVIPKGLKWVLFVVWVVALIVSIVCGVKTLPLLLEQYLYF
ncbi:MAG: PspC domain-containing protein [Bacteroidales bacterium]